MEIDYRASGILKLNGALGKSVCTTRKGSQMGPTGLPTELLWPFLRSQFLSWLVGRCMFITLFFLTYEQAIY